MNIDDIESPEEALEETYASNYWVDTGIDAKFFFVDANYVVLIILSTINLYSTVTWTVLGVSFVFLALLEWKKIPLLEFLDKAKLAINLKKVRRY